MRDLVDDLAETQQRRNRSRCGVARILRENPQREGEILEAIASSYSARVVAEVFRRHFDKDVSYRVVAKHRRGDCACPI